MPAAEKHATRVVQTESQRPRAEATWHVWDVADENAAYSTLAAAIPTSYTFATGAIGFVNSITIREIDDSTGQYEGDVVWSTYEPKEENDIEYEFEVGSQTVRLTHSLGTMAYTGSGRTSPDFGGGINISSDGTIQGIDVERSTFAFNVTKHWPVASITQAYQVTLADLAQTVNNATFYGLPEGTCKFEGARGRIQGDKWPVTYSFSVNPNSTEAVGDITGIAKEGWQYLDIFKMKVADTSAQKLVELPHTAFVHTVFPKSNFNLIGL